MKLLVSIVCLLGFLSIAQAHHVSDHVVDDVLLTKGHARVVASQSGASIELELYTPVVNILSFDNEPSNQEQQNELDAALNWLGDANNLFTFPQEAECIAVVAEVNSSLDSGAGIPENSKHHEFDGYYILECAVPEKLEYLSVTLFKQYPAFKEIFTKVQGEKKVKRAKLTSEDTKLMFK